MTEGEGTGEMTIGGITGTETGMAGTEGEEGRKKGLTGVLSQLSG